MSAPDFTARALALKALATSAASAYDIAIESGFVGDEEEWLESLVGTQGPPGDDGPEGPQGPPGDDGEGGGFGGDLGDPGADRLVGWDESAGAGGAPAYFEAGNGLSITGAQLDVDGWVLLDSDIGVAGVNEVAYTGIPAWVGSLMILAKGVQVGETNGVRMRFQDGTSWTAAADGSLGSITSGSNREVYCIVHNIRGARIPWAGASTNSGLTSSPSSVGAITQLSGIARVDGGIDGIALHVNTGDFDAGDFYLYGRA